MEFLAKIDRETMNGYPHYLYEGEVVMVDSQEKVAATLEDIYGSSVLGFDTETKPAFKKGVTNKVGLMQIATLHRVYLYRLNRIGLPAELVNFLENKDIVKVGVGIRDDKRALQKHMKFVPRSFVDLQDMMQDYGIEDRAFSKMMAIIFGVRISKRQRVTNWEADVLTEPQVLYAATDAWGALAMYYKLVENKDILRSVSAL